jgi:serine/threonine protein phosphatase PrpC
VRLHNEDNYVVLPEIGVWAVADGMGGHESGALASRIVSEALGSIGNPVSAPDLLARLEDRILRANATLRRIAEDHENTVIGSTVAVLLVFEPYYAVVWSGDSRVYLVRNGTILQLSRDHSEVQELIDQGVLTPDDAKAWPRRNVITRALGVHDVPELDSNHGVVVPGDRFVICSDGLTVHVKDDEILKHVDRASAQTACNELLSLALGRGGTDNVTVVVLYCHLNSVHSLGEKVCESRDDSTGT